MSYLLPMDLHSHSENSMDANHPVQEMCEAAIKKGIAIYAITDHYEVGGFEGEDFDFDGYLEKSVREIQAAKDKYKDQLRLLTGIELGQPLEDIARAEKILASHPFDFVLGSMHNAPGRRDIYFYDPADKDYDLDKELEFYFVHLLDVIRWGLFDSASHLTYPFRYIMERQKKPYPFRRWDDHLDTIVRTIAEKGLAMELNTSGITKTPSHTLPEARWIHRFKELGGEKLTLGADAHVPQKVGSGILQGLEIALAAGFRYLCYFEKRQPQYVKIAER